MRFAHDYVSLLSFKRDVREALCSQLAEPVTNRTSRSLSTTVPRQKISALDDDSALNKVSRVVTQPISQGASQAMLYATGLEPEDMDKAQVGISSVWHSGNPCNMHLSNSTTACAKECAKPVWSGSSSTPSVSATE